MLYNILLVCFRFRAVEGRNGEWRGVFSYLRLNLIHRPIRLPYCGKICFHPISECWSCLAKKTITANIQNLEENFFPAQNIFVWRPCQALLHFDLPCLSITNVSGVGHKHKTHSVFSAHSWLGAVNFFENRHFKAYI